MAMGRQKDGQGDLMVSWSEMPRSPGHVFYDRLQPVLIEGGFDAFAEASCRPYYAARMGAPSVPPGCYFRMHLVGYFEGIDSERGLEWRCSDSLSLRAFLRLGSRDRVPDHSWLSRSRTRLPHEVHAAVFDWVLVLIAEAGLIKGERIGVDASTMEANAALRNIVRRDNGEGYREMLERLARESGVETPAAEDLARLDRKRKGKKLSNTDWVSKSGPEAKIAKMQDGTAHLAYKPEHAVDLDTGAVVAAELHPADEGDTTTLSKTLAKAEANLEAVDAAPTPEDPAECVADKGYHSRAVLRALNDSPWKTRIAAPKQTGFSRWHGDEAARRAVTNNRARLKSGVAREAFKLRAEIVERCFAHNLDRGGMRRTWLRGRENVHKRYLLHVAGHNLSLLMRQLIGAGREAVAGGYGGIFVLLTPTGAMLVARGVSQSGQTVFAAAFLIWDTGFSVFSKSVITPNADFFKSLAAPDSLLASLGGSAPKTSASIRPANPGAAVIVSVAATRSCGWPAGRAAAAPYSPCRNGPAPRRGRSGRTAHRTSGPCPGVARAPDRGPPLGNP